MDIYLTRDPTLDVAHRETELVERKGIGHPDSLCDRAAEELSVALSRYYQEHFGGIQHHNTDKALLVGGRAHAVFGRGEVVDPLYLLLSGRATVNVAGEPAPVGEIAVEHTIDWMRHTLPHLRLPGDVIIDYRIKPSSPDLIALFNRPGPPPANDSSFAVAYAPMSDLERLVLRTEEYLNSPEIKRRYPQLGQDIKIMGLRTATGIDLTIAMAFIAAETPDMETYLTVKQMVAGLVTEMAANITDREVRVTVNNGDRIDEGSVYLTATGTSAEQGDDGQVGRGNRANGLITPMRPMTLEAAAGKNPVSHAGKIYQVYARLMVDALCAQLPEIRAATCTLLSRIGTPINEPQAIAFHVESDLPEATLHNAAHHTVRDILERWAEIQVGFLQRRWRLF